jgi:hypothetical protein
VGAALEIAGEYRKGGKARASDHPLGFTSAFLFTTTRLFMPKGVVSAFIMARTSPVWLRTRWGCFGEHLDHVVVFKNDNDEVDFSIW